MSYRYRTLIGWALVASVVTIGVSIGVALGAPIEPTPDVCVTTVDPPQTVCTFDPPVPSTTTVQLADDCLIAPGETTGSTRWSLVPCGYDIGTPVATERTPRTLPATGAASGTLTLWAVGLIAVGLLCLVVRAAWRDISEDGDL